MTKKSPLQLNFLQNIRNYNSAISFASFGANIVKPAGQGPYCFKIHGQIYHKISALHPNENESASHNHLYILDSETATAQRLGNKSNAKCLREVSCLTS
jgi:hypothetical protein